MNNLATILVTNLATNLDINMDTNLDILTILAINLTTNLDILDSNLNTITHAYCHNLDTTMGINRITCMHTHDKSTPD
ncbi:uncharacterized protein IUM83_03595 [Phytophthora cinnamomi]|uniref:uncharacterized protein n=1 Tax=Phytophthora cinnamomi TaxID=4785 RepID=UPI00355A491D|nr:hypothetical protein IUM83_03595 [Phytophthora cinnamomi]